MAAVGTNGVVEFDERRVKVPSPDGAVRATYGDELDRGGENPMSYNT